MGKDNLVERLFGEDDLCPWHSAHGPRTRTIATDTLIAACTPGNHAPPWTWEDEAAFLDAQTCCCGNCGCDGAEPGWYQRHVESIMREAGEWIGRPVMLGVDRIVRDGHHRVVAAWRVGIPEIEVLRADWPLWWQWRGDADA